MRFFRNSSYLYYLHRFTRIFAARQQQLVCQVSRTQGVRLGFKYPSVGLAVIGCAVYSLFSQERRSNAEGGSSARVLTHSFVADAASTAAPAVVNISSISGGSLFMTGSAGSGFIITEVYMSLCMLWISYLIILLPYTCPQDGFIVTNAHVVPDGVNAEVIVTLSDFRKFPAKVHSIDKASDIALVKIDAPSEKFPVTLLGSSSGLRPGDFVIAMGSPLQLQNSVSFGIVSAIARHGSEIGAHQRFVTLLLFLQCT